MSPAIPRETPGASCRCRNRHWWPADRRSRGGRARRRHVQPSFGPEKAFGRVLKLVRKERNISQVQLSEIAGVDRSYVSILERGLQSPTLGILYALAEALEVQPFEMVRRMQEFLPARKWKQRRGLR